MKAGVRSETARGCLLHGGVWVNGDTSHSNGRGPPQMPAALDPETRDWVKGLQNKYGASCCDTADGFPVEVDGWDMAGSIDDTSGMEQ